MKIMAADFDGTLYVNQEISGETLTEIKRWQQEGHQFGVITGRDQLMIKDKLKDYALELDFLIGNNGAVVNGIASSPLTITELRELVRCNYGKKSAHLLYFTTAGHAVYIQKSSSRFRKRKEATLTFLEKPEQLPKEEVIQLSFDFESAKDAEAVTIAINHHSDLKVYALQNNCSVDVVKEGINKATGLAHYLDQQTDPIEEVIVIGDGQNDRELLLAYDSYSLFHAAPEVQAFAQRSVASVAECLQLRLKA